MFETLSKLPPEVLPNYNTDFSIKSHKKFTLKFVITNNNNYFSWIEIFFKINFKIGELNIRFFWLEELKLFHPGIFQVCCRLCFAP